MVLDLMKFKPINICTGSIEHVIRKFKVFKIIKRIEKWN